LIVIRECEIGGKKRNKQLSGKTMISTKYKNKLIILLFILVTFVSNPMAQTNNKESAHLTKLTLTIDNFLKDWLVNKDNDKSIEFFSKKAFSNKEILNESCAGYIKDDKRSSPTDLKEGVTKFLSDFSSDETHKTFDEWLVKKDSIFDEGDYKKFAVALPKTIEYRIFVSDKKVVKSFLGNENRYSRLNKYLIFKNTKTLLIGLNLNEDGEQTIGYVYFIWSKENSNWKIVHAGIFCQ
jgi:hypothetical protein